METAMGAPSVHGKRSRDDKQQLPEDDTIIQRATKRSRREALGRVVTGFVDRAKALVLHALPPLLPVVGSKHKRIADHSHHAAVGTGSTDTGTTESKTVGLAGRKFTTSEAAALALSTTSLPDRRLKTSSHGPEGESTRTPSSALVTMCHAATQTEVDVFKGQKTMKAAETWSDITGDGAGSSLQSSNGNGCARQGIVEMNTGEGRSGRNRFPKGRPERPKASTVPRGESLEGGHGKDADRHGDVDGGRSTAVACKGDRRSQLSAKGSKVALLVTAPTRERWTCTGCFAWSSDMKAIKCDLCYRIRGCMPKHRLKHTPSRRGIAWNLHGARGGLDTSKVLPDPYHSSQALVPISTHSTRPVLPVDIIGGSGNVPSTTPSSRSPEASVPTSAAPVSLDNVSSHPRIDPISALPAMPPSGSGTAASTKVEVPSGESKTRTSDVRAGVDVDVRRPGPDVTNASPGHTTTSAHLTSGLTTSSFTFGSSTAAEATEEVSASAIPAADTSTSPSKGDTPKVPTENNIAKVPCSSVPTTGFLGKLTSAPKTATFNFGPSSSPTESATTQKTQAVGIPNFVFASSAVTTPTVSAARSSRSDSNFVTTPITFSSTLSTVGAQAHSTVKGSLPPKLPVGNLMVPSAAVPASAPQDDTGPATCNIHSSGCSSGAVASPDANTSVVATPLPSTSVGHTLASATITTGTVTNNAPSGRLTFAGIGTDSSERKSKTADTQGAFTGAPLFAGTTAVEKPVASPETNGCSIKPPPLHGLSATPALMVTSLPQEKQVMPSSAASQQLQQAIPPEKPPLFGGFTGFSQNLTLSTFGVNKSAQGVSSANPTGGTDSGTTQGIWSVQAPNTLGSGGLASTKMEDVKSNTDVMNTPGSTMVTANASSSSTSNNAGMSTSNNASSFLFSNGSFGSLSGATFGPSQPGPSAFSGSAHFPPPQVTAAAAPTQTIAFGGFSAAATPLYPRTTPSATGSQQPPSTSGFNFSTSFGSRDGMVTEQAPFTGAQGFGFGGPMSSAAMPQAKSGIGFGNAFPAHAPGMHNRNPAPVVPVPLPGATGGGFSMGDVNAGQRRQSTARSRRAAKGKRTRR